MREIKFRVWSKTPKAMHEVKIIDFYNKEVHFFIDDVNKVTSIKSFDEVKIMRYTGIKDKKGVKIYEGDIIRAKFIKDDTAAIGRVSYFDKDTSFVCHLIDGDYARVHCLDDIKVIGNIYEDPNTTENLPNIWDLDVKIGVNSDNKVINLSKFDKKDVIVGMDNTNGYFWAKVKGFVLNCLCIRSKK